MPVALTRPVPSSINDCELTHLERIPIDVALARAQHREYEAALETLGCTVVQLPALDDQPDSVFVEDTAIVLDEVAILTRPGAESRRGETASMAEVLVRYRPVVHIEEPGTIDGGDVLRIGRAIYVGLSTRTNEHAMGQLRRIVSPLGYEVICVAIHDVLHLKSAATAVAGDAVLLNPEWVLPAAFPALQIIEVDEAEPYAANVIRLGDTLLCAAEFPRTRRILEERGYRTMSVEASELAKAEAALTCCSVII